MDDAMTYRLAVFLVFSLLKSIVVLVVVAVVVVIVVVVVVVVTSCRRSTTAAAHLFSVAQFQSVCVYNISTMYSCTDRQVRLQVALQPRCVKLIKKKDHHQQGGRHIPLLLTSGPRQWQLKQTCILHSSRAGHCVGCCMFLGLWR